MARRAHKGLEKSADDARQTCGSQTLQSELAVGCRVVAQLDSRGCDRLEFLKDGQIVENVLCGTGIDHNCLRMEFVTNMVRGYNC
jgi:hypothetical protein